MRDQDAITAFAALAQTTRLTILKALVRAGDQGRTAGDIAQHIGATPSRASFHLSGLAKAGLITSEKHAREIIYRVNFAKLGELLAFMLEDCCAGNAEVLACCTRSPS